MSVPSSAAGQDIALRQLPPLHRGPGITTIYGLDIHQARYASPRETEVERRQGMSVPSSAAGQDIALRQLLPLHRGPGIMALISTKPDMQIPGTLRLSADGA